MAPFGPGVIFSATDDTHGFEPWFSDGTPEGTRMISELDPGAAPSDPAAGPRQFIAFGTTMSFIARNPATGWLHLWTTDGTSGGTAPLPLPFAASPGNVPLDRVMLGDRLIHCRQLGAGFELLATSPDGVSATLGAFSTPERPAGGIGLTPLGGAAWFLAPDGAGGNALWRTDGTPSGTRPVASFDGRDPTPHGLFAFRDRLFFWARRSPDSNGLFVSDGTAAGTALVHDFGTTAGAILHVALTANAAVLLVDAVTSGTWVLDGPPFRLRPAPIPVSGNARVIGAGGDDFAVAMETADASGRVYLGNAATLSARLVHAFPLDGLGSPFQPQLIELRGRLLYRTFNRYDGFQAWSLPFKPDPSGVWVDFHYSGEEIGTETHPFNTLGEGLAAVEPHGTIHMRAGRGRERRRITQPVRLEAAGGRVRID